MLKKAADDQVQYGKKCRGKYGLADATLTERFRIDRLLIPLQARLTRAQNEPTRLFVGRVFGLHGGWRLRCSDSAAGESGPRSRGEAGATPLGRGRGPRGDSARDLA